MLNKIFKWSLFLLSINIMMGNRSFSQQKIPTGTIKGKILDADTQSPLIGANIIIDGTVLGAVTDLEGNFVILKVPVGNYVLKFSLIGYETIIFIPDLPMRWEIPSPWE